MAPWPDPRVSYSRLIRRALIAKPTFEVTREVAVDSAEQLVCVRGELDSTNAKALQDPFRLAVDSGARVVLLDLSECSFVDSTGLAAIFNGARELKMAGAALVAVSNNSQIVKLFEMTAMGEAIPLFPTRDRALAELDGQPFKR